MVVDDGITQHAVEPRHRGLFAAQSVDLVDPARERLLQDVFGQRAAADPSFEEREELAVVVDEHADHVG